MTHVTVSATGHIELSQEILSHLGVSLGGAVQILALPDGRAEIRAAHARTGIDIFIGLLSHKAGKVASSAEIDEAVALGWTRKA